MDNKSRKRKVREGVVVSNKMAKTVVVSVERLVAHPRFDKVVRKRKKYYAHVSDDRKIPVGSSVRMVETRPLSKLKHWRVIGADRGDLVS